IVEEFVGEIEDEYDQPEPGQTEPGRAAEVAGLLGRAEVAKVLDRELPDGPFDTLAGFVMTRLGRMPEVGDTVVWGDLALTVTALDGRRIDRLRGTSAGADGAQHPAASGTHPGPAARPRRPPARRRRRIISMSSNLGCGAGAPVPRNAETAPTGAWERRTQWRRSRSPTRSSSLTATR